MKAGVAIDRWKLDVFTEILTEEGYEFTGAPGVTDDTLFLMIETADAARLKRVLERCQRKAAELKN